MTSLTTAQTPPAFTPSTSHLLPASYAGASFTPGEHIALNTLDSAPTITFPPSSLVIMLDLDAPFAALNRFYSSLVHWMATSAGQNVVQYGAPAPPNGSADHRYLLLTYDLPANATGTFTLPKSFEEVASTVMSRAAFNLSGFVKGSGVSGPVGANWFTVSTASAPNANLTGNGTSPKPYEGAIGWVGVVRGSVVMALAVTVGILL